MISLTAADLDDLAHRERTAADHLAGGQMSVRTHCRQILAAWNGIGSIDLTDGRKGEYERLAGELLRTDSVVIPRAAVVGLAAAPAAMAIGFGEAFTVISAVATLFALGFALGEPFGEYVRGLVDSKSDVTVTSTGSGDVEVDVDK
jgi:hypothetical protein